LTITETREGGAAQFTSITAGSGSITVDSINSGNGLQSFTLVSATNANVNIPAFTFGTYDPVTATFTVPNSAQAVDFTLRAATRASGVLIRAQCGGGSASADLRNTHMPDMSFWMAAGEKTAAKLDDLLAMVLKR
jgi:hypothetical protein